VGPVVLLLLLASGVCVGFGDLSGAIGVETCVVFSVISDIQLMDFVIDIVNLSDLIVVVVGLGAVVGEPAELISIQNLTVATTQPTTQNNLKQLLLGWYHYR
jgi:5,10-methylene-tetrahydrofolate dehydrogenase/methenyl tetrahydrofolate cyclohydrolase